ncbi:MAG: hypothetical protein LBV07_01110 [Syntrophobacterales bacterium]|jgi:type IV pilus assembly protein PilQ|nr:hypothetical protein [Syntrophobacterales bacterium]
MKKRKLGFIVLLVLLGSFFCLSFAFSYSASPVVDTVSINRGGTVHLNNVAFERLPGRERVTLHFSAESGAMIETQSSFSIVAVMANTVISENVKRGLADKKLDNIFRVSAIQKDRDGQPWSYMTMDMHERVPYMIRKDGARVQIDFNVAGISKGARGTRSGNQDFYSEVNQTPDPSKRITIDFQDANIKSVFHLLAEAGSVNIVSGEDVKGTVTLSMKRVTWRQAFDTVLTLNALGVHEDGDVLIVKTMERIRKDADKEREEAAKMADRAKALEEAEQKKLVKDGKLPQIAIEAKIVEVTKNGSRDLGVLWNTGSVDGNWSSVSGNHPIPAGGGLSGGLVPQFYGSGTGDSKDLVPAIATPLLSTMSTVPGVGVIYSTANHMLMAKLEALESTGEGKIISSPKVTTLDNEKAKIGQGEEIPYVTRDKDGTATIEMKDAKLELEVTPTITSEGKISMQIRCESKFADWNKVNTYNENPPLVASNVESKVVVRDGDTIVLGGILKSTTNKTMKGIPWFHNIPVLGWLFKATNDSIEERELLIFVTPRVVRDIHVGSL